MAANRRERRAVAARERKLSRDAASDEIFPPGEPHGPVQPAAESLMRALLRFAREHLPDYEVTIFLAERAEAAGAGRLPRFNYGSTADRADMVAVLRAFVERHQADAATLDKIHEPPPSSRRQ